jgi:hypothetical protein
VKQLKELLSLNRVDYRGCCEKPELMERVTRLWQENSQTRKSEYYMNDALNVLNNTHVSFHSVYIFL